MPQILSCDTPPITPLHITPSWTVAILLHHEKSAPANIRRFPRTISDRSDPEKAARGSERHVEAAGPREKPQDLELWFITMVSKYVPYKDRVVFPFPNGLIIGLQIGGY